MDIFKKGNRITTNRLNCFEVLDVNEYEICCKDLLNGDFSVFSKTEHKFEIFDVKLVLELSLKEILEETEISEKDKQHVLLQVGSRISSWI